MAKDHIVVAPNPEETSVLIARTCGPDAYPNGGQPAFPMWAFVRDRYPDDWLVRIPEMGDDGATACVTYKGKRGWRCDCPSWTNTRSCKHREAVFVKFGGRPFALPMPALEQTPLPSFGPTRRFNLEASLAEIRWFRENDASVGGRNRG